MKKLKFTFMYRSSYFNSDKVNTQENRNYSRFYDYHIYDDSSFRFCL